MSENIARFVLFFPVFLFSLSFHEFAHAWVANRLGDPTAKMMGRLTMNPLKHIDPIGTFLFPLLMFLVPGLLLFGWARPVPVDPRNLRGGRQGSLRVAIAGPLANILLSIILAGLIRFLLIPGSVGAVWTGAVWTGGTSIILYSMLETGVYLNLMLAFFNLLPIPPLDGAAVLEGVLPRRYLIPYERISRYGFWILLFAFYSGILRWLSFPAMKLAGYLLP